MLVNIRLSINKKIQIVDSEEGIHGKLNLLKETGEKFVVCEFKDEVTKQRARRIYFTENGKFPGATPKQMLDESLFRNSTKNFGEFMTRNGITHFIFPHEVGIESKINQIFENNAYMHLDSY